MTERLYYEDAYLTHFEAQVVEQFPYDGRFAVVLDRTAFYPTSGGQPFDRGLLNGKRVVDVTIREADDAVLHVLEDRLADSSRVTGEVDWNRRFDHMQQHTGQHILSQAFIQVAEAETVGFHLGEESATIDLHLSGPRALTPELVEQAEGLANTVVWQDRPVITRFVSPREVDDLPLRKPPAVDENIRIVQVKGFDWSACGGTHVGRSGEIGLVKIVKEERRGAETRVEFRCGLRALDDYAQKNEMVNQLAAGFNVGYWDLDTAVERLRDENKALRSELRQAGRMLAEYRARVLRDMAPAVAGTRLVVRNMNTEPGLNMRDLARQLTAAPDVVALLGMGEEKAQLCFARSSNLALDMVSLVRGAAAFLGSRKGGGAPDFAQGGSQLAHPKDLDAALEWAADEVRTRLERTE
jgi:alanyl-tRNA synthetase